METQFSDNLGDAFTVHNLDKSAHFGQWEDDMQETSFSTPRKTAKFEKNRNQYTFGGADVERAKSFMEETEREPSISTGSQASPIKVSNQLEYKYNEEPSFQARDSTKREDTVYQYISEEKKRLDSIQIFDQLCDKDKYSTAKVCKISGKPGKLKNWYSTT